MFLYRSCDNEDIIQQNYPIIGGTMRFSLYLPTDETDGRDFPVIYRSLGQRSPQELHIHCMNGREPEHLIYFIMKRRAIILPRSFNNYMHILISMAI